VETDKALQSPTPEFYRDRSTGLIVFGIIQVILGLLALLGIPLLLLSAVMSRKTMGGTLPIGSYVLSVITYSAMAAVFITLGVGSIRARRWARALTLILSWMGLIAGSIGTVALAVGMPAGFIPMMKASGGANPDIPPLSRGFIAVILTIMIVFFAVFFVALPAAFVLFYRRADVRETCEHRDPVERWTGRCPLPVLAASIVFAVGAFYLLCMSFTAPFMPFFGRYLSGVRGAVVCLAEAAVGGLLAIALFRRKYWAWWGAIAVLVMRSVSTVLTFTRGNLLQAYSRMGMSGKQLQVMSANPMLRPGVLMWFTLTYVLLIFGYLIWIKRYFAPPVVVNPLGTEPMAPIPPT